MTDAESLVALHRWVFERLDQSLVWPREDKAKHERRVGQAKEFVMRVVSDMGLRGFLFDEQTVKQNLGTMIADVATRQREGKLRGPLYPYFRAVCRSYVDKNADRLNERAKGAGQHVANFVPRPEKVLPLPLLAMMEMQARLDPLQLKVAMRQARSRA